MATLMETVQEYLRELTGTANTYEGDWHALGDQVSVASGSVDGRRLAMANRRDSTISTVSAAHNYFLLDPEEVVWAGANLGIELSTSIVPEIGAYTPTFARAVTAYVRDHDGIMNLAKSGEARFRNRRRVENILTYSEAISNAAWTKTRTATPDTTTLVEDTSNNTHAISRSITYVAGVQYTYMARIKRICGSRNFGIAFPAGAFTTARTVLFILSGTGSAVIGGGSGTVDDYGCTLQVDGTYLCWMTATATVSGAVSTLSYMSSSTTVIVNSYQGDGIASLYLSKIQINSGRVQDYVSTNVLSAPFHGANVDGVKYFSTTIAGVAISDTGIPSRYYAEREAINTCLYSRTFEDAAWAKTNITPDDNSTTGPDGIPLSASTLTATAGNGTIIQNLGVVASAAKCGSIYIKRKTGTGAIEMTLDGGATWTAVTVTSGWTKVYKTQTLADEDFGLRIVTNADAIYVDFAQVELGMKPTSPIPTVAAPVTRVADSLTYDVTGLWNNTEGTFYAESSVEYAGDFGVTRVAALFGRSTATALELALSHARAADGRRSTSMNNTTAQASYVPVGASETRAKLAIAYKANDTDQAISGTAAANDSSCTVPADLTTLYVGEGDGTLAELDGTVGPVYYWRKKVSAAMITRLTVL